MLTMAAVDMFCAKTSDVWQFIGYIFLVFKIVIPLLLLILGMVDLGKAVVASDDKAIKGATKTLMNRAIAAVIIFFVPTLVGFIFSIVAGFNDVAAQYEVCKACIVSPTKAPCSTCVKNPNDAACKGTTTETKTDTKADTKTGN